MSKPVNKPVNYVEALAKHYGEMGFPPYQWSIHEDAPFTPLEKPLKQCRVALLTSGGISRRAAQPWNPDARNDFRLDEIASDAPADDFQIHDSYYDHSDADQDINTVFPLVRLRELVAEGIIGSVSDRHWSGFMGRIYKRSVVNEVEAPRLAELLKEDRVDALIAVPA